MSTLNTFETLFNISLNQLCQSMNEDTLQYALKLLPSSICIQMLWKILRVDDYGINLFPSESGHIIARLNNCSINIDCSSPHPINPEIIENFANHQQTQFVDKFNISNLIDQKLFFQMVEVTSLRSQLLTLFQIFIQIKGFKFPLNFAQEWINKETLNSNESYLPAIKKGLKLGIFLGDAGWLVESALVLSHTYEIITMKWVCHDQNKKLLKTLQCLTKWLSVVSNYFNLVEANSVLQHLLYTINIIEQTEERTFSISYAYLVVSQYYYILMEFDKAWSWVVKAILELHMASGDLKMLILSHSIRLCCALYKFNMARKLKNQIKAYPDVIVDGSVYIDLLMSDGDYAFNIESSDIGINRYYIALDTARSLNGYYNLQTAIILTNYAISRSYHGNTEFDEDESLRCILQAIFIMQKIGVPNDNMLLLNAHQTKSSILQEMVYNIQLVEVGVDIERYPDIERLDSNDTLKQFIFKQAEEVYLNALKVTIQLIGENTLLTARTYRYLGFIYISQKNYTESEKMYLKEIEITKSILGTDNVEFAISTGHLACLYTHHLNKFDEAKLLLLQTITIYESISDGPIIEFEIAITELIDTYKEFNNMERVDYYSNYLAMIEKTHNTKILELQSEVTEENCTNIDLSLEKFKCILNECSCGQKKN